MKEDEFEKINAIDVKIEIQDLTSKLGVVNSKMLVSCLLYTSPSPRD